MKRTHVPDSQETELERQLLLLVEASSRLLLSAGSPDVLNTLLALGRKFIQADAYAVWWKETGEEWEMVAMSGLSDSYGRTISDARLGPGLLEAEPVAVEDTRSFEPLAQRGEQYAAEGIRSLLIVPLQLQKKAAGTIVFYYRTPHEFSESEKHLGAALANLAAAALATAELHAEQKRIREDAERSTRRAMFLAEVGEVISSSLDYEETLRSIADRSVPAFADWCAVDLLEDGQIRRVSIKHLDPEKLHFLEYLAERFPPEEDNAIRVALRTGSSLLLEEIPDALIAQRAKNEEHLALIRSLGLKSLIVAPMVVRGRTLGCLTLASAESGRRYSHADLRLAEEIARRSAIAIENARLYRQVVASEQQWQTLANSIPQLAWMADEKGWLFWYNQRWYDYTGTTFEEMQGWGWEKVHHPGHLQRVVERVSRAWETGDPWEDTFPLRSKDGEWRWFLSRALPIRDASGRVVRWFGTNTDITELRDTREALEASKADLAHRLSELRRVNRDLEQFAYSASHDLKEPLRNVAIYSEMVSRKYGSGLEPQAREFLTCVVENAKRMDSLVNDLLAFTYAGNSIGEGQTAVTSASEALEIAMANLSSTIAELGAIVAYDGLPELRIQKTHLEQIFQNLLSNALKYRSSQPPRIDVTARRQEENWIVSVADNGIGIEPEYRERIFGIFKRLHTATQYPGTGIGLAICKRIVERYHGHIWVESEPGKGATFFFTLPA